jgi:hypothetical protein
MKLKKQWPLTLTLKLELNEYEYGDLSKLYKCKGKLELQEKIEGALNNWILEMLLDQEGDE